ncbi:MAG: isochorismatase family protein, partial [Zymomonas sp.]
AKGGRAAQALATAAIGSFVAGTIGSVLLVLLMPRIADIVVELGAPSYFAIMLFALFTVTAVLGSSKLRGFISLFLGLTLALVGSQTGQARMTFGRPELADGIDVVVVAVAIFAIGEALWVSAHLRRRPLEIIPVGQPWMSKADWGRSWKPWLRGTAYGFPFGALPAGNHAGKLPEPDPRSRTIHAAVRLRSIASGASLAEPSCEAVMRIDHPHQTALLLIDVVNDFDFPDADKLLRFALPAARNLAKLKERLRAKGVHIIHVNDNFGHWQSDFREQIERCSASDAKGSEIAKLLLPEKRDYFVLKPRHSGFYSTPLDVLLAELEVRTLVLSGFAGDICVLYTANDAYMRGFEIIAAADCIASESEAANNAALQHMEDRLKAGVHLSRNIY